jgi:hypothetical protein
MQPVKEEVGGKEEIMKRLYVFMMASFLLFYLFPASKSFSQYDPGEPDTVRFGDWSTYVTGPPYQGTAVLPVTVFNDEAVSQINIPLTWEGPLMCDSGKFVGDRTQFFMNSNFTFNNDERWLVASATGGEPVEPFYIPPGEGEFLYLYFSVLDTGFVSVDSTSMFGFVYLYFLDTLAYEIYPQFTLTEFHILPSLPGDVNGDGEVNAGDVIFLINYLFKGGLPPDFPEQGDINGDCLTGSGDVVYLINYLFRNGPAPVAGCIR